MLIDCKSDWHIESGFNFMPYHCDRDQRVADLVHQHPCRALALADPLAVIDRQETCEAAGSQDFANATFEIVLIARGCGNRWPTHFFKRSDLFFKGTDNSLEAPIADKGDMLYDDLFDHYFLPTP